LRIVGRAWAHGPLHRCVCMLLQRGRSYARCAAPSRARLPKMCKNSMQGSRRERGWRGRRLHFFCHKVLRYADGATRVEIWPISR
jgi:hypothetical protein